MQDNLLACQQNNQLIRKLMLRIFGKFEKLMHLEGRVSQSSQDAYRRDLLIQAQQRLLDQINGPSHQSGIGLDTKLKDLNSTVSFMIID